MTGLRIALAFVLALGVGPAPVLVPAATAQTITATAFTDYPPFTTDALPRGGFSTALVEEAFQREGYRVEHKWMPWARGYLSTLEAATDVTHPYFYRRVRAEAMLYSEPFFEIPQRLYTYADDDTEIDTIEDLDGRVLCSPLGYSTPDVLGGMIADGRLFREQPTDLATCFRMLSRGRVDAVLANALIFEGLRVQSDFDATAITYSGLEVERDQLHLLVSRSHPGGPEIIETFNRAVADMAADGSLAALAREYEVPTALIPQLRQ